MNLLHGGPGGRAQPRQFRRGRRADIGGIIIETRKKGLHPGRIKCRLGGEGTPGIFLVDEKNAGHIHILENRNDVLFHFVGVLAQSSPKVADSSVTPPGLPRKLCERSRCVSPEINV